MTGPESWLSLLAESDWQTLLSLGRRRRLAAGEALFRKDDRSDCLAVVETGRLAVSLVTASGREIALDYAGPGGVLGELGVFDGSYRSADVTAIEASAVTLIPADGVRDLLRRRGDLALAVLAQLSQRLRRANNLVEDAGEPLEQRLARAVLRLTPAGEGAAELRLTQSELAAHAGLARENVNRQLKAWADRGLVALGRGRLRILDRTALQDAAGLEA